ncbi:class I SAM-dependent methyltransferase [Candidatus Dependentiae bacterium]|nr:class I SAM-dependent methyltransferase [Candidatus Dependentiae bacterium]
MNRNFKEKFVNELNSRSSEYKLVKTDTGYYKVEPRPTKIELEKYYSEKYYENIDSMAEKGMDIGKTDKFEKFHFERHYEEISLFLENNFQNKHIKILDAGCGLGKCLLYLKQKGFDNLYGLEFEDRINNDGIYVYKGDFLETAFNTAFDFIMFNNVIEHVPEPEKFICKAYKLLNEKGVVRVQVPNDLSYTQYKAVAKNNYENFYFYNPYEHLNYFSFESVKNELKKSEFEILKTTTDFSMDQFLLMDIDYSKEKQLGELCHKYRINFEYNMGNEYLEKYYEKMAEIEIGRVVIAYGRK